LSVPGYTVGDTSITVGSTSNWSTDTGVTFAIDQAQVVNGVEVQIAGTYNEYVGTVASGTSVSNVSWATGSGNRNYSAGALTRVYIPVSATRENRIVDWGLTQHNQDGTHGVVTATSLTATAGLTVSGGAVSLPAGSLETADIADSAVTPTKSTNPYKFRVYRNAAANTGAATPAKITFDAENFDTNNNFATGTYTAPVNGYYQMNWRAKTVTSGTEDFSTFLYINGAIYSSGGVMVNTSQHVSSNGSDLVYMTAGQTAEIYSANGTTARALQVGTTNCYFSGFLVSIA